jgi:hypothetical protein
MAGSITLNNFQLREGPACASVLSVCPYDVSENLKRWAVVGARRRTFSRQSQALHQFGRVVNKTTRGEANKGPRRCTNRERGFEFFGWILFYLPFGSALGIHYPCPTSPVRHYLAVPRILHKSPVTLILACPTSLSGRKRTPMPKPPSEHGERIISPL